MKENGARESVGIKKYDNHLTAPTLIIQEGQRINNKIAFPNVYHILQCLTTKNAKDSFDLERYEVMGDCYLKLIVVMKIYLKFTNTNEGNMAELKSQRVSNKYLFKLAHSKQLYEYISYINFQPKVNWIGPNYNTFVDDNIKDKDNCQNFYHEMSDKTLADCVEALIGCYLIHSGQDGAKAIIQWLDFKISNQEGPADFLKFDLTLPKPAYNAVHDKTTLSRYIKFAEKFNYKFNDIMYLYQAFTHPSCTKNRCTASYQK